MNTVTTNILTTTNGVIITVTKIHRQPPYMLIGLALLGLACLGSGLYLLLRKEKTK